MALPTNELEWVNWLARRHDAEMAELEMLDRYYEGTQPVSYMHPDILREVADRIRPVIIFWPQLATDSVEERLDVEGFRLPDADTDEKDLWRVWQANDLDETSQLGHVDALVMRRAYIAVGTNEDDEDTPLVTVESPLEVFHDLDPRTRQVRAALRRVGEEDIAGGILQRYATLYLPDTTVFYRWDRGWRETDRDEHGLGEVPIVPLVNRGRLRASRRSTITNSLRLQYGRSELDAIIPLSDAANKLATDMMVAGEFVAIPLRGLFGVGPGDLEDQDGNKLTALQAIMGRLIAIAETEAKAFEFAASQLSNFHEAIEALAQLVASIAGLPPHYLGVATDNPASADAIRSAESRLVKRAERKQRAFGGSWERMAQLVRRFQTGEWDPKYRRLETIWRDASTPTVAQSADAAVKKFQARIVPLRQTRQDLGYTDGQITLMEAEDAKSARENPLTTIARAVAGGEGGGEGPVSEGDS